MTNGASGDASCKMHECFVGCNSFYIMDEISAPDNHRRGCIRPKLLQKVASATTPAHVRYVA